MAPPMLSEDIYRFLWDGHLITQGINPHDFTPNELMNGDFHPTFEMRQLYPKITELSKANYSCYPFVTEIISAMAAFCSKNITLQIIVLKLLFLGIGISGFQSLKLIAQKLKFENKQIWLFLAHPLLIIEGLANLHFEWIMVALLIITLRFLIHEKWVIAAIFLGLAVQVKLIPLILLPFLLPYFGWKKMIYISSVAGCVVILTTLTFVHPNNAEHFFSALALYYSRFEFNSSLYQLYLAFGKWKYGFYPINHFGMYLSRYALMLMLLLAWFRLDWKDWKTTFRRITWAFLIYYLFASTVHPWYILIPLLFGILAQYTFVIWWAFLVWMSYLFYDIHMMQHASAIKHMEYILLLVAFWKEAKQGISNILFEKT